MYFLVSLIAVLATTLTAIFICRRLAYKQLKQTQGEGFDIDFDGNVIETKEDVSRTLMKEEEESRRNVLAMHTADEWAKINAERSKVMQTAVFRSKQVVED